MQKSAALRLLAPADAEILVLAESGVDAAGIAERLSVAGASGDGQSTAREGDGPSDSLGVGVGGQDMGGTSSLGTRSRKVIAGVAVAGVVFVASVALAEWLANGTGEGYAKAGHVHALTTESATPSETLYPGVTGDLSLRINNPNPFAVTVTTVSPDGDVTSDSSACDQAGNGVTFAEQPTSLLVPASSSASFVLADSVTMAADAPSECEGATFAIPVSLNGGQAQLLTWYADADADGFGDPNNSVQASTAPAGHVADNTDCDDTNPSVHPGAIEVANGIDDNCNGTIDEGVSETTWYADADGDGFGDPNNSIQGTIAPAGYVADNTDCDDTNPSVHPGATEVANGIDDNCNGTIDEGVMP